MTRRSSRFRAQKPGPAEARPLPGSRRARRRGLGPDPGPCLYLRPGGGDGGGVALSDRCHAGERPIRVGDTYIAAVCRTASYGSCPRFVEAARAIYASPPGTPTLGRKRLPRTGIPSMVPGADWLTESARATAHPLAAGGHLVGRAARSRRAIRRVSLLEVIALCLAVSIVFAFLFVGYAFMYRVQLRAGVEVTSAPRRAPVSAVLPGPTLVPTFTPTPFPAAPSQATAMASSPATATALALPAPGSEPEPALPRPTPIVRLPAVSPPTRVIIPKIDVDIPVIPVGLRIATIAGHQRVVWSDVAEAAAFHETSAYPGNPGNTVINGHRDILGSVFRHLDELETGDEVILYVGDVPYPYFVTETLVVPDTFASNAQRAKNAELIGYFPEERLTLVTCTPVGLATHRLVVIAKPLATVAPEMPEAGSDAGP